MTHEKRWILPLTIFLMSLYLLLLEILLTRIFSVLLYYHFAFMAISIALLGLGSSGMSIYFFPKFFSKDNGHKQIVCFFVLFSISLLVVLFAIINLRITLYITISSIFKLILLYLLILFPFLFGGMVVSLILMHFSEKISTLYFFDLVGASLGTISVIILLKLLGGINGLIFISLLGIVGAIITSFYFGLKKMAVFSWILTVLIFSLLIVGIVYNPFTLEFTKGAYDVTGGEIKEFSAWNAISRVDLFAKGNTKYILIDSDAYTEVVNSDVKEAGDRLSKDLGTLAYYIKPNSNTLIIGAGGGIDVLRALVFNETVTGVEINEIIVNDLMKDRLKEFSKGLYFRGDVNIIVDEGRSFIRRSKEKYGIIQMSLVDTWAATAAGAFTLTENNLYTVEAFIDYLNHLKDNGVFTAARFTFAKPQETIRLTGIGLEALKALGVKNPSEHIIIIKQVLDIPKEQRTRFDGVANLLIKKSAFTKEETDLLVSKANDQGFEILYNPFNMQKNVYNELIRIKDREAFFKNYPLDISPTTDDRPFFFYTIKLRDTLNPFKLFSEDYQKELSLKTNLGLFLLLITFILTFGLALLFILVPLIAIRRKDLMTDRLNKFIILLYFAGLGFGFILIEVVLMQKFILFLGHPVYSLGVTLFSLLVFSGIGSYTTNFVEYEKIRKHIIIGFISLLVIILIYRYLLSSIFNEVIGHLLVWRVLISVLLLAPVGLILGRFFPLGIKLIDKKYHMMVPWAWGVNGTTSVVGSVLALILAINFGFNNTLLTGVGFYLLTSGIVLKEM